MPTLFCVINSVFFVVRRSSLATIEGLYLHKGSGQLLPRWVTRQTVNDLSVISLEIIIYWPMSNGNYINPSDLSFDTSTVGCKVQVYKFKYLWSSVFGDSINGSINQSYPSEWLSSSVPSGVVYVYVNKRGPSTEPCESPHVNKALDEYLSFLNTLMKCWTEISSRPMQCKARNSKPVLEVVQRKTMVHSVKCSSQVKENKCYHLTLIRREHNVIVKSKKWGTSEGKIWGD